MTHQTQLNDGLSHSLSVMYQVLTCCGLVMGKLVQWILAYNGLLGTAQAANTLWWISAVKTLLITTIWTTFYSTLQENWTELNWVSYTIVSVGNFDKLLEPSAFDNVWTRRKWYFCFSCVTFFLQPPCSWRLKPCPHCRRKVGLSPNCHQIRRLSPFSINQSIIYLRTQAAIMTWNKRKNECSTGQKGLKKQTNRQTNKQTENIHEVNLTSK